MNQIISMFRWLFGSPRPSAQSDAQPAVVDHSNPFPNLQPRALRDTHEGLERRFNQVDAITNQPFRGLADFQQELDDQEEEALRTTNRMANPGQRLPGRGGSNRAGQRKKTRKSDTRAAATTALFGQQVKRAKGRKRG